VIVISDASPLIALAAVKQLDLLRALYGEVVVPAAVYEEITAISPAAPEASAIRNAEWIQMDFGFVMLKAFKATRITLLPTGNGNRHASSTQ
jgi:predicted nucleic acid-binding protein